MLGLILVVLFFMFVVAALPTWPHSRNWGYYPSGGFGFVFIVLLILVVTRTI